MYQTAPSMIGKPIHTTTNPNPTSQGPVTNRRSIRLLVRGDVPHGISHASVHQHDEPHFDEHTLYSPFVELILKRSANESLIS